MTPFLLTPAALSDLQDISNFVAADSPANATKILRALEDAMRLLARRPRLGRQRDDLGDEPLRMFFVHSFAIIYKPDTRPLQIVRVLHGARDIETIMGDSEE